VDLNALAAGSDALIIDPTGGLIDLDKQIIRATSEEALLADSLRLLRGVRLAVQLGFEIEPRTTEMVREHAASVRLATPERQRDELLLILATNRAASGLRLLEELGLLSAVLPELDVMRGVEQPKEHHWDVFGHSIGAVDALDWLIADSPPASEREADLWRELRTQLSWWPEIQSRWQDEVSPGIRRSTVLKLAALLHDIGKPTTKSVDADGSIHFFGHSSAGSDIAGSVLKRLRLPTRIVDHVTAMIDAHLRPLLMAREGAPSRRALHRFFRDTGEAGVDTLFLSLADHLATVGPKVTTDGWRRHVAVVGYILASSLEQPGPTRQHALVNGDDLMAELAIGPGVLVGELLEMIAEAQAAGEVKTREGAIELAHNHLARNEMNS
jgi:poly(A) polymerase